MRADSRLCFPLFDNKQRQLSVSVKLTRGQNRFQIKAVAAIAVTAFSVFLKLRIVW